MDLGTQKFRRRFKWALASSLMLHAVALLALALKTCSAQPHDVPLVITLLPPRPPAAELTPPPQPEGPRNVVDAVSPTAQPPAATANIAEQDTRAQDLSQTPGAENRPQVEDEAAHDQSPASPQPPAPPVAAQPPPKKAEKEPEKAKKESQKKKREPAVAVVPQIPVAPEADTSAATATAQGDAPEGEPPPPAHALPESDRARDARGRVGGGVTNMGFLGYEALRSEVAPYLKEVRKRVERNWYAALQMRYSGSTPTRAVVECAIGPNGQLVHATILEAGDSATYAPLCREAIERAAPFPPFPFQVPQMYRDKNLVIRWTFDFLR